jgi:mannose-6-phosphate isomerase-like protein (cupin superfamily)
VARILLEPGEEFEHSHSVASVSLLETGRASIRHGEKTELLTIGVPVVTPANVSHTIVNTGTIIATVNCQHAPPPE